ncbi:MAG TPA: ATP-binding protein [Bosea sp. (in: a-proteobacteria)]|jgi:PAS domain S-box-containing protein|uniref:PAS domain-containing sensor histidine kinase n=1 Tax=Bosea sp. (in: a-proteobacteria) TaxID=1871050 RepID=UPI002E0F75A9|nr:ATP-binding protein [Bosea sp. (in: a-proteobacteria)]
MSLIAFRAAAILLALGIFLIDTLTPLEGAVAVLYVVVVLLAARTARRTDIIVAAAASIALTVIAYVDSHGLRHVGSPTLRALVSLAAIGIVALLALHGQKATETLSSQARLLNLSHDMIFVRDRIGVISFWNNAAEEVYGFTAREAVGRMADDLLRTRYSEPREAVEATLLETGRWDGRLEQRTKGGKALIVESRWAMQRDRSGKPTDVLETHTDVTERQAAHAALIQSERRYRRMFDATRIGVIEEDWTAIRAELARLDAPDEAALSVHLARHPDFIDRARKLTKIVDVNPAFLAMAAAGSASHLLSSVDDILSESDRTFPSALMAFARGETFYEGETEITAVDGRRIPVLFAITFPRRHEDADNVLVFVIDNSERKQAQDALLAAQAELAHAARVATLGELTASIAHEVNQPLMAVVTSGEAGMRWLRRETPDLKEVEAAIGRVIAEGRRASEIVKRIRAFLKKAPAQKAEVDIAAIAEEATQLVERELARGRIELRTDIDPNLPPVSGDRVQLQQVLVNLMVNASQAMAGKAGARLLCVRASLVGAGMVEVTVADTGPGIGPDEIGRLFDPFFTTKPDGMGMGLAICRTTAEAHDGTLSVESAVGTGATFRLSLPVREGDASHDPTHRI